jgi:hypothetical protein
MGQHFAFSWVEGKNGQESQSFLAQWYGLGFEDKNLITPSEKMFYN